MNEQLIFFFSKKTEVKLKFLVRIKTKYFRCQQIFVFVAP
jgi:hypothetical protein